MFGFGKKKTPARSLESRLELLERAGVTLNRNAGVDDLLGSFDRNEYEGESFGPLVFMLGSEIEAGPHAGEYFSNQLWLLDTERIEDDGDYSSIVRRFNEMFSGELVMTAIRDAIDFDRGSAQVRFESDGKEYRADLRQDDDWMDPGVLRPLLDASADAHTRRVIGIGEPDGQSMSLCVLTPAQMTQLNSIAGTSYRPLTPDDF